MNRLLISFLIFFVKLSTQDLVENTAEPNEDSGGAPAYEMNVYVRGVFYADKKYAHKDPEMNSGYGDVWYDKIPDDRNAIAQYFELYSMSGELDDFKKQVDFTYENVHLIARIKSLSPNQMYDLENKLETL